MQSLGTPKVEGIEDSGSEQKDGKQRQDQTRKRADISCTKDSTILLNVC